MNNPIPVPSKGDGLKATWAASVANGVNALMPMAASGMLARNGAGGVGSEPLPKNQRDRNASTITLPWTFRCTVTNPGTADETRTGGWYNGQIQLGLGFIGRQNDTLSTAFTGYDQTADGDYYLEVKPSSNAVEIKRYAHQQVPSNDIANDTYYVYVGTVENAVQTDGIYCVPVVYKYL